MSSYRRDHATNQFFANQIGAFLDFFHLFQPTYRRRFDGPAVNGDLGAVDGVRRLAARADDEGDLVGESLAVLSFFSDFGDVEVVRRVRSGVVVCLVS